MPLGTATGATWHHPRGVGRRLLGGGRHAGGLARADPPSPPDAVSAPDVGGTGPVGWLGGFLFGQGAPPVCGTGYVSWLSGRILTWLRSALPDVGGTGSGSWLGESMGSNDTFVSPGRTPGPVGVKVKGPHTPPTPTPPWLSGGRQGWGGTSEVKRHRFVFVIVPIILNLLGVHCAVGGRPQQGCIVGCVPTDLLGGALCRLTRHRSPARVGGSSSEG